MGHTPGPWYADCNQFYPMGLTAHIIRNASAGDNGVSSLMLVSIADVVYSDSPLCETHAAKPLSIDDARLISAAPDLLSALKTLVEVTTKALTIPGEMDAAYAKARAAISVTEGKQ